MKEKWLSRIKSVKFWLSLTGAVVIVLQLFGLKISAPYINEVVSAICSVFVVLGIMVPDADAEISKDDRPAEDEVLPGGGSGANGDTGE